MRDESASIGQRRPERVPQDDVRRRNLSQVLRRIHVGGPASRSRLAAYTGLNRSTVGALVADLAARGLVRERHPGTVGIPGRPSPVVEPNPDGPAVLALEVFADSLAAATIGIGGLVRATTRTDRSRTPLSPEATVEALVALSSPLLGGLTRTPTDDAHPTGAVRPPRIVAVGVAVAGVVRRRDGVVMVGPNLGWREAPFARLLRTALPLAVPVHVANDGDLAALAEHVRGAGAGCDHFICLWGEVGVGAGIIADGRPLTGVSGFAGEIGHLSVRPDGRTCHCGARGCWETEIGEDALLGHAGSLGAAGGRPGFDAVLDAAGRGDPRALAALEAVGRWLGVGLAGIVNIFNPRRIALGGRFAAIHPFVDAQIEAILDELAMAAPRSMVEIVPTALGLDAPLHGAAELAFEQILDDPTSLTDAGLPSGPAGTLGRLVGKEVKAGVPA
ncbi:MAG: ROK family transcriptional regulator [Chloroflexi bacterium]|nr:ROK family transcriptional regulator [Chloroflexota bacterium]